MPVSSSSSNSSSGSSDSSSDSYQIVVTPGKQEQQEREQQQRRKRRRAWSKDWILKAARGKNATVTGGRGCCMVPAGPIQNKPTRTQTLRSTYVHNHTRTARTYKHTFTRSTHICPHLHQDQDQHTHEKDPPRHCITTTINTNTTNTTTHKQERFNPFFTSANSQTLPGGSRR